MTKQDTNSQEFTVVLLDSEGIDAVIADGSDDHCILTLTILLASVLIYNSAGVPSRNDLDGLEYPFGVIYEFIHDAFFPYLFIYFISPGLNGI